MHNDVVSPALLSGLLTFLVVIGFGTAIGAAIALSALNDRLRPVEFIALIFLVFAALALATSSLVALRVFGRQLALYGEMAFREMEFAPEEPDEQPARAVERSANNPRHLIVSRIVSHQQLVDMAVSLVDISVNPGTRLTRPMIRSFIGANENYGPLCEEMRLWGWIDGGNCWTQTGVDRIRELAEMEDV